MKPREFDELVRQKFDQNDFAYSPHNWDRLAEQLEGRAKKRSMLMWLWMPAAGMAASVALAIGVTSLLRFGTPATDSGNAGYARTGQFVKREAVQQPTTMIHSNSLIAEPQKTIRKTSRIKSKPAENVAGTGIGLKLHNILNSRPPASKNAVAVLNNPAPASITKSLKKEKAAHEVVHTFKHDIVAVKKPLNLTVILSGGVSQGNRNSGYMAGATIRKMINDKVYVESDVALTSSDNIQRTMYMSYDNPAQAGATTGAGATAAKPGNAASKTTTIEPSSVHTDNPNNGTVKTQDISYNLYYAQVSPAIGYKIMKRMSIGMGPDFQKMLVDNRPATSEVDRGNLQVAPTFDVGFVGKTEYALTQRVKAGVSYRKGINGVINMSNKYIDRDYIQFQMRCTIFNR